MKLIYHLLFLYLLLNICNAQRRASSVVKNEAPSTEVPHKPISRGRTRYTAPQELAQTSEQTSTNENRRPTRRRIDSSANAERPTTKSVPVNRRRYEVEESIDEPSVGSFKKHGKSRVLTETHFEAPNAPKRELFKPQSTTEDVPIDELIKNFGSISDTSSQIFDTTTPKSTDSSLTTPKQDTNLNLDSLEEITTDITSSEIPKREESTRTSQEQAGQTENRKSSNRRSNFRTRARIDEKSEEAPTVQNARIRRVKATRRPVDGPVSTTSATSAPHSTRIINKGNRRTSAEAGPSVFSAEETQQSPSRTRAGRRIDLAPEKLSFDLAASTRTRTSIRKSPSVSSTEKTVHERHSRLHTSAPERNVVERNLRQPTERNASFERNSRSSTERNTNIERNLRRSTTTTERNQSGERNSRRRGGSRFSGYSSTSTVKPITNSIRSRSRSRTVPQFDERKLEVLPLFENEPRTVAPITHSRGNFKGRNSVEETVQFSATENDVKYVKPELKDKIAQTPKPVPKPVTKPVTKPETKSVTRENKTETTAAPKRQTVTRKANNVKQSVVSHITEVTSKRTLSRRRNPNNSSSVLSTEAPTLIKVDPPKISVTQVVSRGRKKADVKVQKEKTKSSSEEDIDESDNYPEAFKALLQAKKNKKESRTSEVHGVSSSTNTDEKVVTSSEASSTTAAVSSTTVSSTVKTKLSKEEDLDNELVPKVTSTTAAPFRITRKRTTSTPRSYRHRQTLPTRAHITKTIKSSTEKALPASKDYKFHAKIHVDSKNDTLQHNVSSKSTPKPRGIYSSKNSYKNQSTKKPFESGSVSTQIPKSGSIRKSNRYSSRYRSDNPSRGIASRSTTSSPAYIPTIPTAVYIPTIPTITPSTSTSTVKFIEGTKDTDLGVEVITFDDPVNTVPSANLVSGEYLSSSNDAQNNVVPVVTNKASTTEKPVSIIERIINSITAISTTASPDSKTQTVTPRFANEPTIGSAILKLATKRPTKFDGTTDENDVNLLTTSTSEKPTTVIERILNSLSAIQAHDIDKSNFIQVGNDFNTISFPSTTPLSRVTKSAITTLSAPTSTVNPLSVLDEISEDQILEKRTIGKLLALLNGLTTTLPPQQTTKLVVVTPKPNSFVSGSFGSATSNENLITSTPPAITTDSGNTATSTPEFTSPSIFTSPKYSPNPLDTRFNTIDDSTFSTLIPEQTTTSKPSLSQISTYVTQPPKISAPITTAPVTTTDTVLSTTPENTKTPLKVTINEVSTTPMITTQKSPSFTQSVLSLLPFFVSTKIGNNFETTTPNYDFLNSVSTSTENGLTDTDPVYSISSTIPSLRKFEVSPGSVSIYSANDLSNTITPDDNFVSTVTIPSRTNVDSVTTQMSTKSADNSTVSTTADNSTTPVTSKDNSTTTSMNKNTTTPVATTMASSDMSKNANISVTNNSSISTPPNSGSVNNTVTDNKSNQTMSNNVTVNALSDRSGRLLNVVQDPVQNSIDSTQSSTPDYFIFAVLPNNTILRKRPSSFPTKETPFLIVGVYPNNTIVRKFPNGTLVPMEPIIRVRGFDTRENPPLLPEITSNQVTNEPGSPPDNTNVKTVDDGLNKGAPVDVNALSIAGASSTPNSVPQATTTSKTDTQMTTTTMQTTTTNSPTTTPAANTATTPPSTTASTTTAPTTKPTLPSLSNLLNGKTVQAFNELINNSNANTSRESKSIDNATPNYQTTVKQWNQVVNIQDLVNKNNDNNIVYRWKPVTKPIDYLQQSTPVPTTTKTATITNLPVITTNPTIKSTTPPPPTTVPTTKKPFTSPPLTYRTTTSFPATTFFPTLFSTILSTLQPRITTLPPKTTTIRSTTPTEIPTTLYTNRVTTTPYSTTLSSRGKIGFYDTLTSTTTDVPSTTVTRRLRTTTTTPLPTTLLSTLPSSTIRSIRTTTSEPLENLFTSTLPSSTRRSVRTTTSEPLENLFTSTLPSSTRRSVRTTTSEPLENLFTSPLPKQETSTKKLKQLTEEQKKNLEMIAQLEREQSALLQQLSILTNLGLGGNNNKDGKITTPRNNLANRIIQLAMERDKSKITTHPPKSIQDVLSSGTREGKKLSEKSNNKQPVLEDVLKQYDTSGLNLETKPTVPSTYGKSNDAILAALLKEQGIGPTTPKGLVNIYSETTTTTRRPRPKTTTRRPSRLMQGLNWLLNALAPPPTTTKRPKPKSKKKPKNQEILSNQPTHITPVVTPAPNDNSLSSNSLSQDDIRKLIKQLEAVQKDPKNNELDLTQVKSLQHLINADEGVQIIPASRSGSTSRASTRKPSSKSKSKASKARSTKTTTVATTTVDNSLDESEEEDSRTTTRSKVKLPPVRLRPVPGIDDDENSDPLIRSNLITAAVNVTRAISSFLGSALQGAATSFQSLLGSGSRLVGNYAQGSSVSNRPG